VSALTARNVALTDQILALLDAESPLPASTPELYRKLGRVPLPYWRQDEQPADPVYYSEFYRMLARLARLGEIEKWAPDADRRACYWRRLGGSPQ
jgi:hypothetical protein